MDRHAGVSRLPVSFAAQVERRSNRNLEKLCSALCSLFASPAVSRRPLIGFEMAPDWGHTGRWMTSSLHLSSPKRVSLPPAVCCACASLPPGLCIKAELSVPSNCSFLRT